MDHKSNGGKSSTQPHRKLIACAIIVVVGESISLACLGSG